MEQVKISKNDLQDLVIYAQRYTIGRTTYAPSVFRSIILKHLDALTPKTIQVIITDIEQASQRDGLGWECDKKLWLDLLAMLKVEIEKRGET